MIDPEDSEKIQVALQTVDALAVRTQIHSSPNGLRSFRRVNNVVGRLNTTLQGFCMYVCMYVCMVITYSRVWINRVRLPILLVVN